MWSRAHHFPVLDLTTLLGHVRVASLLALNLPGDAGGLFVTYARF